MKENALEALAHHISGQLRLAEETVGKPLLLDRLQHDESLITDAYQQFSAAAQSVMPLTYVAEWLLDNFFIVQQTIRQIREDLPVGYYRELPKLGNPAWENLPRCYALASELINYCNDQFDIEQTICFLQTFQANVPLTMGELWAFPTMLRLDILSRLATVLGQPIDSSRPHYAVADESAVRLCIASLRLLIVQDWKVFFEQVSLVDQILRRDPANIYEAMDFDTRNSYREVIERLARLTKQPEVDIAQQAVMFGQKADVSARQGHVGFYLIGEGYRQLEDRFQYRASGWIALRRWLIAHPSTHGRIRQLCRRHRRQHLPGSWNCLAHVSTGYGDYEHPRQLGSHSPGPTASLASVGFPEWYPRTLSDHGRNSNPVE